MTDPAPQPSPDPNADPLILPREQPAPEVKTRMPIHYYLLWIIAVTSLGLNLLIIKTLLDVRKQAAVAFTDAATAMGNIQTGTIDYTVEIDERIPIALDVPVQFTVEIPIRRTIPINTVVDVPIEIPLFGTQIINVPISTTVPISIDVEVPVDETVPINGFVPVRFEVPIKLNIADTTFGEGLEDFQLVLEQQAASLRGGQ